jgi:hypothetical protein
MTNDTEENEDFQVTTIPALPELVALDNNPSEPRNWSIFLRAPLSYFELFGVSQ